MRLCDNRKCPVQKKPYPPGIHGKKRRRSALSEYGAQLLIKQKTRRIYGVKEKQFRKYFKDSSSPGLAIQKLEMRIDNVVFRMGLASTRAMARQLVSHGHILINGKKVKTPSYQTKVSQTVSIKEKSRTIPMFEDLFLSLKKHIPPSWVSVDAKKLEGKINAVPSIDEAGLPGEVTLIGEFYSR